MTIVQLEYLLAVANHGSFSTAAEYCFVTQPSLSTQISNLENELGVILLDRGTKPIVPTEVGQAVLEQAKLTIAAFYNTKERVSSMRGELSGKLRLGVIPTISPYLMPGFVTRFIKKHPDVKFDIYDMHTSDIVDALSRDVIDVAILSGGQSEVKIKETELFDDKLYVYVSPENELYGRREILGEEIDVKKLLLLSEGNCLRNQVLKLCRAKKDIDSPFNFINGSLENLMYTVDRTSGITIIPAMAVGHIPEDRRRQIIPFGRAGAKRKITMAVAPTYVRESLVSAVRESVMAVANEEFALSEFFIP
ncbi:MAG: LysR family transcriptional regulator [Rikenellaceae bacterium]|jgi:LysR family hydrogen peroxide-inducible transcriptional activator|nr:LysR family transcriptional regulator [Rikenellaceae bacterium]